MDDKYIITHVSKKNHFFWRTLRLKSWHRNVIISRTLSLYLKTSIWSPKSKSEQPKMSEDTNVGQYYNKAPGRTMPNKNDKASSCTARGHAQRARYFARVQESRLQDFNIPRMTLPTLARDSPIDNWLDHQFDLDSSIPSLKTHLKSGDRIRNIGCLFQFTIVGFSSSIMITLLILIFSFCSLWLPKGRREGFGILERDRRIRDESQTIRRTPRIFLLRWTSICYRIASLRAFACWNHQGILIPFSSI